MNILAPERSVYLLQGPEAARIKTAGNLCVPANLLPVARGEYGDRFTNRLPANPMIYGSPEGFSFGLLQNLKYCLGRKD